ncbi:ComEA family DNA-binding protein [Frigoribacterium sp. RIT-PI-h]|uniref:ComEA family DNA-binding protein n=1 Tax=Frigoribacterium sp. RIT-PI-h TaxID=1690245 RepID=UPI0009EA11AA
MTVSFRTAVDPSEPGGPRWRVGLGAVVVLLFVVLAVSVAVSAFATRGGAADELVTVEPSTGAEAVAGAATAPPGGAPVVFVHVHGRVAAPGLYELAQGARVVDVVAAAGGFTADADQAAVNLARVLVDGEQLRVPAVGETVDDGAAGGGDAAAGGPVPGGGAAAGGGAVDLNLADDAALQTLPGVGPATAAAILSWRDENGRFRSVDDLLGVPGIGPKTLEELRDRVRGCRPVASSTCGSGCPGPWRGGGSRSARPGPGCCPSWQRSPSSSASSQSPSWSWRGWASSRPGRCCWWSP